jgi:hypothetical protein
MKPKNCAQRRTEARLRGLHKDWFAWIAQARLAIEQGQTRNVFVAHCHPDNRPLAFAAYNSCTRLSSCWNNWLRRSTTKPEAQE